MRDMQYNVEFGDQLSIYSRAEEYHRNFDCCCFIYKCLQIDLQMFITCIGLCFG
jgi:hypothetical protein